MKAYQQMKCLSHSPLYDQVSTAERHQINEQTVEFKNLLFAHDPSFEQDMERKNRELVVDLLKNGAASTDWQSPRDGSIWRLLNVMVPHADVAKIACSYIGEVGNKAKKFAWRLPSKKELEKALASGILAANPAWATGDQELRVFATSSASPPKAGLFSIKGENLTEIFKNSSISKIICVY